MDLIDFKLCVKKGKIVAKNLKLLFCAILSILDLYDELILKCDILNFNFSVSVIEIEMLMF